MPFIAPRHIRLAAGAVKSQLAAAGVAAAWRLGKWEALDSYLQQSHAGPASDALDGEQKWDTRIGHILAAMHRRCCPDNCMLPVIAEHNARHEDDKCSDSCISNCAQR